MSKTGLLCSLISMKTHSSFSSHSTFNPLGNTHHSIFKIHAESDLCSLFLLPLWSEALSSLIWIIARTPIQSSCLCPRPTTPPHPALSTEARAVTLNVSPCWSHAVSHCHLLSPGHWCGPLPLREWFSSGSMDLWMCTQVPGASNPTHRGAEGYFPQLYWDIIGIHHCISLRWTAEQSDLHVLLYF